jgi:hypothetical protein
VNWLQGRVVRFDLSSEGQLAFAGTRERESIIGLVEVVDSLGAWIAVEEPPSGRPHPLRLLRWNYISTAVVEMELIEESPRPQIGFGS